MAIPLSPRPVPQLVLQCGITTQLAPSVAPGWREPLQQVLAWVRQWRARPSAEVIPLGYEALTRLDEHLLADIGAPESVRERARHCRELQQQRVLEFEHGHRSIGDGRW